MIRGWLGKVNKDEADEIRKTNEKKKAENAAEVQEKEKKAQEKTRKEMAAEFTREQRVRDAQVDALEDSYLTKTASKTEMIRAQRNANMDRLDKVKRESDQNMERKVDKLKRERDMEIEEGKKTVEKNQARLAAIKDKVANEHQQKLEIHNQGHEKQRAMEEKNDLEQREATAAHQSRVLDLKKERGDILKNKEVRIGQLEAAHEEKTKLMLLHKAYIDETAMLATNELVGAIGSEDKYDQTRNKCLAMLPLFNRVQTALNAEEISIMTSIQEMDLEEKLSSPIDLENVTDALQNYKSELEKLTENEHVSHVKQTYLCCDKLRPKLRTMQAECNSYGKSVVKVKKSVKKGEMDRKSYKKMVDSASKVKNSYEETNILMLELNELTRKFNLPPSQLFQNTLNQQIKALEAASINQPPPAIAAPEQFRIEGVHPKQDSDNSDDSDED